MYGLYQRARSGIPSCVHLTLFTQTQLSHNHLDKFHGAGQRDSDVGNYCVNSLFFFSSVAVILPQCVLFITPSSNPVITAQHGDFWFTA